MLQPLGGAIALFAVLVAGVRSDTGLVADAARQSGKGERSRRVTVSAAISLSAALEDTAAAYASAGGGEVAFNFAASNVLARQIVNGARVDIFISADEAQMDVVERAGLVAPGTRVRLVGNRLALVAPAQNASIASVNALTEDAVRRVAIGDPEAVPAGVYARQYLERTGLWHRMRPKLVPMGSVRAALAAVEAGAVDAGFVYVTDVRSARGVRLVAAIDGPQTPAITYPMCVVTSGGRDREARSFHGFLQGPGAAAVLRRHGFMVQEP